jgi:phosphatidylserine decarboxylase
VGSWEREYKCIFNETSVRFEISKRKQYRRDCPVWKFKALSIYHDCSTVCLTSFRFSSLTDKIFTQTGWDMDPFVVISFGKKVFRTRVIRHSGLGRETLFHFRRYETALQVQLTILDWR